MIRHLIAASPELPGQPWSHGVHVPGPVVADPGDPNAFPPAANRILVPKFGPNGVLYRMGGLGRITFLTFGTGTRLDFQPWFYDNNIGMWLLHGPGTFLGPPPNFPGEGQAVLDPMIPGIEWFVQITNVTGSITDFYYTFN